MRTITIAALVVAAMFAGGCSGPTHAEQMQQCKQAGLIAYTQHVLHPKAPVTEPEVCKGLSRADRSKLMRQVFIRIMQG